MHENSMRTAAGDMVPSAPSDEPLGSVWSAPDTHGTALSPTTWWHVDFGSLVPKTA